MVKVRGPLISIDASGTLGDAITYSKWKGRSYVRRRVIPANPQTGAQTGRRAMFSFLTKQWDALSSGDQATWQDLADDLVVSPFHAFLSFNVEHWHNFMAPTQALPATRAGTPGGVTAGPLGSWRENRIAIGMLLSAVNDNWAIAIYASPTALFDTSVANCIMVQQLTTTAMHEWLWTPPTRATWWVDGRLITTDGLLDVEQGEDSAIPP